MHDDCLERNGLKGTSQSLWLNFHKNFKTLKAEDVTNFGLTANVATYHVRWHITRSYMWIWIISALQVNSIFTDTTVFITYGCCYNIVYFFQEIESVWSFLSTTSWTFQTFINYFLFLLFFISTLYSVQTPCTPWQLQK